MPNPVTVNIPDSIRERLEKKVQRGHYNAKVWTPAEDAILIVYWPQTFTTSLSKSDVASEIGCAIETCRKRYQELMSAKPSDKREPTTGVDSGNTEGMLGRRDKAPPYDRDGDTDDAS